MFVSLYCVGVLAWCVTYAAMLQTHEEIQYHALPLLLFGMCVVVLCVQSLRTQGSMRAIGVCTLVILLFSTLRESFQPFPTPYTMLLYGCVVARVGFLSSVRNTLRFCVLLICTLFAQTMIFQPLNTMYPISFPFLFILTVFLCVGYVSLLLKQMIAACHIYHLGSIPSLHAETHKEKEQFIQLHKLAALGKMTSGLMHDLIHMIYGSNLSLHRALEPGTQRYHLRQTLFGIKHALSLIESARLHTLHHQSHTWFSPLQEIKRVHFLLHHSISIHAITFTYHQNVSTRVYGDRTQFYQIMQNLVSNAVDALAAHTINISRHIHIECGVQRHGYIITVADNGPGIQVGAEFFLFQPFFTTKLQAGGTGIGLSLVKEYVEESFSGKITFTTSAHGTTFFITVPLHRIREYKKKIIS